MTLISTGDLKKLYEENRLSANQIAKKHGCSKRTILRLMESYKIPRRSRSEAHKGLCKGRIAPNRRLWLNKKEIEDLYWKDGASLEEIADKLHCSGSAIRKWMIEYDIPRRSDAEGTRQFHEKHPNYRVEHLSITNDELTKMYLIEKLSSVEIAKRLGVSDRKIRDDLARLGVHLRTREEAAKKGADNPSSDIKVRQKISAARRAKPLPRFVFGRRKIAETDLSHKELLLEEIKNLEAQGFRCISLIDVIPDGIAIKNNKIFAIEVETGRHGHYAKYVETKNYFDDIFWIIARRPYNGKI